MVMVMDSNYKLDIKLVVVMTEVLIIVLIVPMVEWVFGFLSV